MKYPYSSPNFSIADLLRALVLPHCLAEQRLKAYFSSLTGKKYILLTNSCRTALYLSYKAAGLGGEVITTPLTCKVAIDPIEEAGYKPVFADISMGDLNINPSDIEHRINPETKAIQAIHLGGVACKMDEIKRISEKHHLWLIEDCAQALGAKYNGRFTGTFGDIACFSLIKNGYGIGGGVLATDDVQTFKKANEINVSLGEIPKKLLLWRVIRNLVASKRNTRLGNYFFTLLLKIKGEKKSYSSVVGQLYRLSPIELKIAAYQSSRYNSLHHKRKQNGKLYYSMLTEKGLIINDKYDPDKSSYTKFFIHNPSLDSQVWLKKFNSKGVEAMHLEEKTGSPYQEQIVNAAMATSCGLNNYHKIHGHLISLPLCENFDTISIAAICDTFTSHLIKNK